VSQCFAYNQNRQRCDGNAGHDDEHFISFTWGDDECFDPSAPVVHTIGTPLTTSITAGGTGMILMNSDEVLGQDPLPLETDDPPCFVCACPKGAHDNGPCVAHDCKSYIP